MSETTYDEQLAWLRHWGSENKCLLEDDGEIGFGRPCVGLTNGNSYIGLADAMYHGPEDEDFPVANHAYHKDDYLAVCFQFADDEERTAIQAEREYPGITQKEAMAELYEWVKQIDELGYTVEVKGRQNDNVFSAILHGLTEPVLAKKIAS